MSEENKEFSCEGIEYDEYKNVEEEGEYRGRLVGKRWGKKRNLIAYFELNSGEKIVGYAWNDNEYLHLNEMKNGTAVRLRFVTSTKSGKTYLREVKKLSE